MSDSWVPSAARRLGTESLEFSRKPIHTDPWSSLAVLGYGKEPLGSAYTSGLFGLIDILGFGTESSDPVGFEFLVCGLVLDLIQNRRVQ